MRFCEARPGDHLLCPFECDQCSFYRLYRRVPTDSDSDRQVCAFIRRANLDAFWAREPGTVKANLGAVRDQVRIGEAFRFEMFDPIGPFGRHYDSGLRAAIGILHKSQKPGRHEATVKFSSLKTSRAAHTNVYRASALGYEQMTVLRSDRQRSWTSQNPTNSEWFSRFILGLRARLGERRKQDAAISIGVMKEMQRLLEERWTGTSAASDVGNKLPIAEFACFALYSFCVGMRGYEVPRVVLDYLRQQIVREDEASARGLPAHLVLPLVGRWKQHSNQDQTLVMFCAGTTASGLQPLAWTERLLSLLDQKGIQSGWLFQGPDGQRKRMMEFADTFYELLLTIQSSRPDLISEQMDVYEDFGLARSFRRGADTHAQNQGVSEADINWIFRWSEGAGASNQNRYGGPMRVLYSDQSQMAETFLRFSSAL